MSTTLQVLAFIGLGVLFYVVHRFLDGEADQFMKMAQDEKDPQLKAIYLRGAYNVTSKPGVKAMAKHEFNKMGDE